ncbi:OmpA family protein [Sphingomonas profundi]|uniref:OmpA family protein n=1 Tax=Alterirhizorhabdus profundi TaxID=2681549 RepID=UPI0012E6FB68|nr:OmpA family protein [Sphingomonas profundi]
MKLHVGLSVRGLALLGCAMAMAAPAWAAPDAEEAQFTCDLTGDCDTAAEPAAAAPGGAPATATPGKPAPRGSATRGFSFRRGQADGAPTQTASVAAPAPAAAPPKPVKPMRVGSADLGLTFEPASAVLTEASKARLAKYANALATPKLATRRLRIEGHTDASGSPVVNRNLSQRRAQAVADYLVQAGVDRQRLDVAGFGSSRPLPGVAPQAAANRRVMAVLL